MADPPPKSTKIVALAIAVVTDHESQAFTARTPKRRSPAPAPSAAKWGSESLSNGRPRAVIAITPETHEPSVRASIEADLALADPYDDVIRRIERVVQTEADVHDPDAFELLRTVPGIGKIRGLTLLYEIQEIGRFPSVQDFSSYCRLVKSVHTSAGKRTGSGGAKRMAGANISGEILHRLAHDLDAANNSILPLLVRRERLEVELPNVGLDEIDALKDMREVEGRRIVLRHRILISSSRIRSRSSGWMAL